MKNEFKDMIRTFCLHFKAYRAYYSKGDYEKGLKLYQQLIDSDQRDISAHWGMGVCCRMLGDNVSAEAAAKKVLKIKQNDFRALQLLASIYSERNKDEITYEYVSRALSNIPPSGVEISPRMANFAKKIARYIYSGKPEDYVEENLGLDVEDRVWISWASDFKKKYESRKFR
jgi:tetratricopeptide (TPR) repeat protein